MNLQEFIAAAITQIVAGVAEGREAVKEHDASAGSDPVYGKLPVNIHDEHGRQATLVEFDIALTQADSTNTKGAIGVFLGSVGLGSQAGSRDESTSHSRLKFSVPIVLPGKRRPPPRV